MIWIAPSEKDTDNAALEKRLWDAADQFRANSASDARSSEQDLCRQLIESRAVDVMVAVGPNMFYTVTLPCTLWFLDKSKSRSSRRESAQTSESGAAFRVIGGEK